MNPDSSTGTSSLGGIALRLLAVMIFAAFGSVFVFVLFTDGYWQMGVVFAFITIMLVAIFLRERFYPLRWMAPGLAFLVLISVYPIIFTIYIAFTNFGTGNLLLKPQIPEVLSSRTFLPEEGVTYDYTLFRSDDGERYALWLNDAATGTSFLAIQGSTEAPGGRLDVDDPAVGPLDAEGIPETISGYERLTRRDIIQASRDLAGVRFGAPPNMVEIRNTSEAAERQPKYVFDEAADTITDLENDIVYTANDEVGYYVAADGTRLDPGYQVVIGGRNFSRFLTNPSFRGPLLRIFVWTFAFALLSVLFSFSLGLLIAIAFGRNMPFKKFITSALIIPFAIPNVITVLIWKGLFNPRGVIGAPLASLADTAPFLEGLGNIFADAFWVKVGILVVNVWLAYPYFMLINSGALQAIPTDMYEAADIDGANVWHKFRHLTLPLLLVGVGPLLIASFTANFNSFNVIFLFNGGGPAMVGTSTPAGHSDILISYVYRLAFGSGGGQDYGYASAITIIIFFILVAVTLFQFRYMKIWEEVGEGV